MPAAWYDARMRAGILQSMPAFGDPDSNLVALTAAIDGLEADFFVLPELCLSGYDFDDRAECAKYAMAPGGGIPRALADAAHRKGAGIAFGFVEAGPAGRLYNSSLLSFPDGRSRVYRKTHLFARENECFDPGDTGFFVEEFSGTRIGPAICFDWIFPESFRTLALLGADLIAHSANLVLPWCQRADFARAVENRVYVCTANRVGAEERSGRRLAFTGGSVLVAPDGGYLARLPEAEPGAVAADIDPLLARDKRINPWNDLLADRRPSFYAT